MRSLLFLIPSYQSSIRLYVEPRSSFTLDKLLVPITTVHKIVTYIISSSPY